MRPVLFTPDTTDFTTNGIGRIDCLSCIVTEERNGMYELEAVVPENGQHVKDIELLSILCVRHDDSDDMQPFRVYEIKQPINGRITIYAQHISYQLANIPTMPFNVPAQSTSCGRTLELLKYNAAEACPFDFWTDIRVVASYQQSTPATIWSRLKGVQGSVLDQFGGEYEWDKWTVKLHQVRGTVDPVVSLRYGKNIVDIDQEKNIISTITGVCPYWADSEGELVTLPEKVVESDYADRYPFRRTIPLDLSQDYETKPTVYELRNAARAYINKAGIGLPKVSIRVSFVQLWQTEEYKDIAPLQRLKLCDYVNIDFERLGISEQAKVVKTRYDVLKERYESMELGSIRSSIATTITDLSGAITAEITRNNFAIRQASNALKDDINNATAWLTGSNGYVMAVKNQDGTWKELLFLDHPDAELAIRVLRINENGLGFSSTGIGGPYTQAWTLDGRILIGGTNVPSLTVYKKNGTVLFRVFSDGISDGIEWNTPNSTMAANGCLTLIGGSSVDGSTLIGEISGSNVDITNINASNISRGTIDGNKVGFTQINGGSIKTGTIQAGSIAAGAITADKIAAGAITANKISTGAVTADKIAAEAITAEKISVSAVTAEKIASSAITTDKINASAVTANKIAANAVTASKIEASAVTAEKIAANAITASKIEASAVTAEKIAANAITASKIEASAVTAEKIASSAITTDKINANAVTANKISTGAVTADKIAAGAITADKIEVSAVTADKIAAGAVTASKIQAGAITAEKIAADAITGKTISGGFINGATITSQNNTDGATTQITGGGIVTNNIVITKQGTNAPCIWFKKDASTAKAKGLRFIPANSYEVSGEWNVATLQVLGHTQLLAADDPEDLAAYMAYRFFVKGDSMFSGNILPGYGTCEIGLPDDQFERISTYRANIGVKAVIGNDVEGSGVSDPGLFVNAGDIRLTGDGNIFVRGGQVNQSDRNLKHDIQPISEKYEELFLRLKPCTYVFDGRVRTHIGMISQDVVEEMEECGITSQEYAAYCKDPNYVIDKEGNRIPVLDEHGEQTYTHMLRYEEFIGLNTHMIQKLYMRVKSLEAELEALKVS